MSLELKDYLRVHKEGLTLKVKVQPRAKKKGFLGTLGDEGQGDIIRWGVSSPPEKGKANEELLEGLSKALQISNKKLSILSGEHHRTKVVLIRR